MRHENDQVPVHPTALMVGADLGLDTRSMKNIIKEMQERLPMLLIGGNVLDVMIISTYAVLRQEDHMQHQPDGDAWADTNRDEVMARIENSICDMYAEAI